jgi:hypothetical protein
MSVTPLFTERMVCRSRPDWLVARDAGRLRALLPDPSEPFALRGVDRKGYATHHACACSSACLPLRSPTPNRDGD